FHFLSCQLDPGLKDWREYTIAWYGSRTFAKIIATRVAFLAYDAGKEYWLVDKTMLTNATDLVIQGDDMNSTDPLPTAFANTQEFVADCSASWTVVSTDLTTGLLYKHATEDYYVRIAITGTAPNKTISTLRWYQKKNTTPAAFFDPRGTYTEVSALGAGTIWYADSLSP
ncbi:MAG TPA: hypothetical protein VM694_24120, partial [Polyangium sp.]|nr:hypothetical protein [Polyangium sp.]